MKITKAEERLPTQLITEAIDKLVKLSGNLEHPEILKDVIAEALKVGQQGRKPWANQINTAMPAHKVDRQKQPTA